MSKKATLITVGVLTLTVAAGFAGVVIGPMVMKTHDENYVKLEDVGEALGAKIFYEESTGELGAKQLPATFAEDQLSPTQKVIKGLINDRDSLIEDNKVLEQRISSLKMEIAALEQYKANNERYAPLNAAEEAAIVEGVVKKFLVNSPDANRFSNLQIEVMSASSAQEYSKFAGRNQLILEDEARDQFIERHFPEYAFCVGDGIDVAANSNRELRAISRYIRSKDASQMSPILLEDLKTVLQPCQTALFTRMSADL